VVGHIRIRTTNYQYHTVSVYLHIAAPLFRLSRIGMDFSCAIRLAIRPAARLFGFAHVFDVYTSSYCAQLRAAVRRARASMSAFSGPPKCLPMPS